MEGRIEKHGFAVDILKRNDMRLRTSPVPPRFSECILQGFSNRIQFKGSRRALELRELLDHGAGRHAHAHQCFLLVVMRRHTRHRIQTIHRHKFTKADIDMRMIVQVSRNNQSLG